MNLKSVIVLPPSAVQNVFPTIETSIKDLDLNPANVTFIQPLLSTKLNKEERLHIRDRFMLSLADLIVPIYIRPDGFWSECIRNCDNIDNSYAVEQPVKSQKKIKIKLPFVTNELKTSEWLYHWTRTFYGPWPNESLSEYFYALTNSLAGNPRDAFSSLLHILNSGIILSSGRMFRGQTPGVSLSHNSPESMMPIRQYRTSLGRWNWEPYGIAIPFKLAQQLGAKPVIYGDDKLFMALDPTQQPYFQYQGKSPINWVTENEWRLIGDLHIKEIMDQIKILVLNNDDFNRLPKSLLKQTIILNPDR